MANEKIMLSISNPVFAARLNNDGGLQYSGTNIGSVSPNGAVRILAQSISFLIKGFTIQITAHIPKSINEKVSHAFMLFFLLCKFHFRENKFHKAAKNLPKT